MPKSTSGVWYSGYRIDAELGIFSDELEMMRWLLLKLAEKLQITGLLIWQRLEIFAC